MHCYHPIRIDNYYDYACGVCFACRQNRKKLKEFNRSKCSLFKRFKQYIKKLLRSVSK